jgi:hypothetical protein
MTTVKVKLKMLYVDVKNLYERASYTVRAKGPRTEIFTAFLPTPCTVRS